MRFAFALASIALLGIVHGQSIERTSKPTPLIGPVRATMEAPLGWTKTRQEQWASAPGKIVYRDPLFNEATTGDWSLGLDNFKRIEVRSITLDGKPKKLILIYKTEGSYRYPAIHEDWLNWTRIQYFVVDDLTKIAPADVEFNKAYTLKVPVEAFNDITFAEIKSEDERLKSIGLFLANPEGSFEKPEGVSNAIYESVRKKMAKRRSAWTFEVGVFPVIHEGSKKARFLWKLTNSEGPARKGIMEELKLENATFDTHYYETDWESFRKFWETASAP